MKSFYLSSIFLGLLCAAFLLGLFTNNAVFFGSSFCLWTPFVAWWGYSLANAGLRLQSPIAKENENAVQSRPTTPRQISRGQAQGVDYK